MRQCIKDFVSIASVTLPIKEPIYEFGSLQVPGQEGFADLRPLFPNAEYIGCDMRSGTGVDEILNLHDIDKPEESVGTVLCLDTLEHVEYPYNALKEIHRILRPDGIAIISSVMKFRIHSHPYDYWRFTPEAFKSILKPFSSSFVGFAGEPDFPHTVVGIGFRGQKPDLKMFEDQYMLWHERQAPTQQSQRHFREFVKLFVPPIFIRLKNRIITAIQSP
jgi:SAM-dependent methyltransferase